MRLTDSVILAKFEHALSSWRFTGYITWKPVAREWLEKNIEGYTTRALGEEMYNHFSAGGEIDQVVETREEWTQHGFHYDFRMQIGDRFLYIETVVVEDDPADPTIYVVSIHDV